MTFTTLNVLLLFVQYSFKSLSHDLTIMRGRKRNHNLSSALLINKEYFGEYGDFAITFGRYMIAPFHSETASITKIILRKLHLPIVLLLNVLKKIQSRIHL